jgi:predicted ArsR family transcriptional regulator
VATNAAWPPQVLAQSTRARLFAALAELQTPATTADLAKRLGLHVNGVRRQLERLHDEGLVRRERARGHRGRPRDIWSVSGEAPPGLQTEEEPYLELARWLARAIPSRPGRAEEIQEAGRRIGYDLAPDQSGDPGAAFTGVLRRLGFQPSVEEDPEREGGSLCRLGKCPYAQSVKENPEIICALHRGITEGLLERLKPEARLTRFDAREPDQAGCELEIEGLELE